MSQNSIQAMILKAMRTRNGLTAYQVQRLKPAFSWQFAAVFLDMHQKGLVYKHPITDRWLPTAMA